MIMTMARMTDDDNGYVGGDADDCDDDDDNRPHTRYDKHYAERFYTYVRVFDRTCLIPLIPKQTLYRL